MHFYQCDLTVVVFVELFELDIELVFPQQLMTCLFVYVIYQSKSFSFVNKPTSIFIVSTENSLQLTKRNTLS